MRRVFSILAVAVVGFALTACSNCNPCGKSNPCAKNNCNSCSKPKCNSCAKTNCNACSTPKRACSPCAK